MKKTFKIFKIISLNIDGQCIETFVDYSKSFDTIEEAEEQLFEFIQFDQNRFDTFTILPEYKLLD